MLLAIVWLICRTFPQEVLKGNAETTPATNKSPAKY